MLGHIKSFVSLAMYKCTRIVRGGGDKSMFAAKRRVIHPLVPDPVSSAKIISSAFTTDPLKESNQIQWRSGGALMNEMLKIPNRLEGARTRRQIEDIKDEDFKSIIEFVQGADYDQIITGRRFQKTYDQLTTNDDIFVWLCYVSMAVLNPGDVRSRLMHQHLTALADAVIKAELPLRTAFRFYVHCVRSPAYRAVAARQSSTGAEPRVAGLCAAAEALKQAGMCKRPLTAHYQLFQRVTERSEAFTPWAFPPLHQFEEQVSLERSLRFFTPQVERAKKARRKSLIAHYKVRVGPRIYWKPPTWNEAKKWPGPTYHPNPGVMPD